MNNDPKAKTPDRVIVGVGTAALMQKLGLLSADAHVGTPFPSTKQEGQEVVAISKSVDLASYVKAKDEAID